MHAWNEGDARFLTFSCFRRLQLLSRDRCNMTPFVVCACLGGLTNRASGNCHPLASFSTDPQRMPTLRELSCTKMIGGTRKVSGQERCQDKKGVTDKKGVRSQIGILGKFFRSSSAGVSLGCCGAAIFRSKKANVQSKIVRAEI